MHTLGIDSRSKVSLMVSALTRKYVILKKQLENNVPQPAVLSQIIIGIRIGKLLLECCKFHRPVNEFTFYSKTFYLVNMMN